MAHDDSVWRRPAPGSGTGPEADRNSAGTHADDHDTAGTHADDHDTAGTHADDRPVTGGPGTPAGAGAAQPDAARGYAGPPPTLVPPRGWRPPAVVAPHPPRELPYQDHDALDAAEQQARTRTYGIGLIAGAVILIMLCAVCGRWFF